MPVDVLRVTLRQLQIFVAVARSGSTTAASGEIALSQSATSAAINELERVLSLRLFNRVGRRLLLNDNGRALLPRALALLGGAADIEGLACSDEAQAQSLRVGASTTIGNFVLPRLLSKYLHPHQADSPGAWQSKVLIANTADICEAVAAFELDIGLIEGPSHEPALKIIPWLQDDLVVVTAPTSEIARQVGKSASARVPLRTLREQLWLLRESGSGTREVTDQALLPHLRSYRRSIELGSSEAIKRAVAEGLGIACLSTWVVSEWLATGQLVRLPTTLPKVQRQCYIVLHAQRQPTSAMSAFMKQASLISAADAPEPTAFTRRLR
jgi:DNA-binding transcriptional LysR family regulator